MNQFNELGERHGFWDIDLYGWNIDSFAEYYLNGKKLVILII
jgi:hypothetical protein